MNVWYLITLLGDPWIWSILTPVLVVVYVLMRKRISHEARGRLKAFVFVFAVSVWLTLGTVFLIKNLTNIERPCVPCSSDVIDCNPYCLADNSFPSGHSALMFAVFSSVYICFRKKWLTPLFLIPFMVSVSRYFLVVHHMMDIVAGTVIGVLIPIAALSLYEKKFQAL